jgi:hypothetical protein
MYAHMALWPANVKVGVFVNVKVQGFSWCFCSHADQGGIRCTFLQCRMSTFNASIWWWGVT